MFAREGYFIIAGAVVLGLLIGSGALWFDPWLWRAPFLLVGAGVIAFTLYFFRDPDRSAPAEAREGRAFVAPADGKIVEIVEEEEPLYLEGPSTRISIFLSPLNVHVNRVPANGVIEYVRYVPGDYLVAWHPKASEKNERSEIGMEHESGTRILFKQIAGAVARRIEYHVEEGDSVVAGERFGIVKFGSRMDVHVPPHIEVNADVGDRTTAGETVLGQLPDAAGVVSGASLSDSTPAPETNA
ncbi:phosphatidylserine decarboxylase family protein [Longibacter salinarum]|uniref:phosphatidylserine decarboxylase family protein n=1 Tax=Longibacter salinarum TaxID=1850348 RepID=UPI0015CF79AA|nr:phosphatidylserine decarboxylase family protein [Longibacter salinarum]